MDGKLSIFIYFSSLGKVVLKQEGMPYTAMTEMAM